jgi:sec-independent protein translocase protein TatC
MTLIEHLFELRNRLFKGVVAVLIGMIGGLFVYERVRVFLEQPYLNAQIHNGRPDAQFLQLGPTDLLILNLKIALFVGVLISAPIWLYQIWSFITPGLHRNEKRWAYAFVGTAVPLFILGAAIAYYVVQGGLEFLLPGASSKVLDAVELVKYIDFITSLMLLFGAGFEFPLVVVMLNVVGLVSARRLLSWWRVAVFLTALFAAFVTPTPDPFTMLALAVPMSGLYFAAVGLAFLNDRRRARRRLASGFSDVGDDEISELTYEVEAIESATPIDESRDSRYDDAP